MASKPMNAVANGSANSRHTITALSRWSIIGQPLPAADKISTIHVYDFDNTLFQTPLPNPKLWNGSTLGQLGSPDMFINGGWWHDARILAATGEGAEAEEAKAWSGWWNEKIVELVHLSMKQDDALTVLLTGRSERGFSDLVKRIVTSKGLVFDLIGLKPEVGPNSERFRNTMTFKQTFLEATIETYRSAQEIRIYEDRPKHVVGFQNFLVDYNNRLTSLGPSATRPPIAGDVVQVAEISTNLDPVVEVAEVQHLINSHNAIVAQGSQHTRNGRLVIRKTVFFTSYMLKPEDTKKLIALASHVLPDSDLKYNANTIIITPRPCPRNILDKVGGMNAKMKWEVTGIGSWNHNIWAISVKPVPANAVYHTDLSTPMVVLATRKGARPADAHRIQNWQPIPHEERFVFETTVGEKVMLRIEPEDAFENEQENIFPHKGKRKHTGDEDSRPRQNDHYGANNSRDFHTSNYRGRGGSQRGSFRGGGGANGRGYRTGTRGGRGGGRGGRGGYRSLDDVGTRDNNQGGYGGNAPVSYDDEFPTLSQGPQGGSFQPQQGQPPPHFGGQPQFQQQGGYWQGPGGGNDAQPQARSSGGPGDFGNGVPNLQNFY